LALVVFGCAPVEPSPQPASQSPVAATAAPTPTPTLSPVVTTEEKPRLLLTVPYAPRVEALGATTSRVGGTTARGATSFAVDEQDRIYIWDQARLRVAVFESGKPVRAIALPYVERDARALLLEGDRLYLRSAGFGGGGLEYEIDASNGTLLRAVRIGGTSIYPRLRTADDRLSFFSLADALGFGYQYLSDTPVQRYVRRDSAGRTIAFAVEPLSLKGVDVYVRRDGALYELASDFGGVGFAYVYALLAPAGSPSATARGAASAPPTALGKPVPDSLTATLPNTGSVDLDATARAAFWWLASTGEDRGDITGVPGGASFVARWNDGASLEIGVDAAVLSGAGRRYLTQTRVYEQVAAYFLAAPSRLASIAAASGATVRITDLPGAERRLTTGEVESLRASLASAFAVSEGELPGTLELPFPTYEISVGGIAVRLRGDRYASVGRLGAFVHDGALDGLARRLLPQPALSVDDPRSLFLADRVMFDQDGLPSMSQDISRWKASIVRGLTGLDPLQGDPSGETAATFTFSFANGRSERVRVSAGSFTFRGRRYDRPGVLSLVYYRGVP
jgi:hypothetical protein